MQDYDDGSLVQPDAFAMVLKTQDVQSYPKLGDDEDDDAEDEYFSMGKPANESKKKMSACGYNDQYDANDSASAVTWNTDIASTYIQNPTTVKSVNSSALELHLNFLAKELELERLRRENLQHEVERMTRKLDQV